MNEGIGALSEREKETLRFLLVGHDAKSIALKQGLSVHTINERLRDARRKLGVSSSREAARLLAEAEHPAPNSSADNGLGVAPDVPVRRIAQPIQGASEGRPLAWLGPGMLIMLLVTVALLLSSHLSETVKTSTPSADRGADMAPMPTRQHQSIEEEVDAMARDVSEVLHRQSIDSPEISLLLARQVYLRSLSEAVIFKLTRDNRVEALATVNFDAGMVMGISRLIPAALPTDRTVVSFSTNKGRGAVVRLAGFDDIFLAGFKAK